jgi:protein ImuB
VRRSILALAQELARILARRGEGSRRLELTFFRTDGAVRRLAVETGRPVRDPEAVLRLYRERLDALADPVDPGFGFDVLRLAAVVTERLDPVQTGLDGNRRDEEALADLADRLGARLGGQRVLRLAAEDTHHPERASQALPSRRLLAPGQEDWSAWIAPEEPPARPLRLLDPPERVEALAEIPDGPPVRFRWRRVLHAVRKAEGPERIAPEWWREAAPTRDYFRVEDEAGRRFWLYREGLFGREVASPRWYVHGLFA